jgi:hypothetical protein
MLKSMNSIVNKENRVYYVKWIEQKWGVVVNKTTLTQNFTNKREKAFYRN